jgi:hypothetical protein
MKVENENETATTTTTTPADDINSRSSGVIVIVAKCPIKGKSKTRLMPLLGEQGSVDLARAMLSDVLLTIEHCVSK